MKKPFLFIAMALGFMQANAAIQNIRWGSSGDPLTGLTVTWSNTASQDSIKWGYTTSYEQGSFPAIKRSGNGGGYFLKYVFPGVNPSSAIYYQLYDSGTHSWGAQRTFNTAPPSNSTSFTFLGMGDSRSGVNVWGQIAALANTQGAAFSIFNGDIVADASTLSEWTDWFNSGKQFIENNLIYHSMGNHDAANTSYYSNTFDLPQANGTNLYYSFTYGNAVFICLNSENASDAAQYNWLVSTLQANQSKKWKIVFFHRPFYTIGPHAGEMNAYFNTWWKAFDDYGVDIICNGHDHMYERSKPINRNISTSTPPSAYGGGVQDGRCQIVCGGAGAPLYTGSATWFVQKYQSDYNFCRFDVNDCKITVTAYTPSNAVIETFTLNKCMTGVSDVENVFNKITIAPNPVEGRFSVKYKSPEMGEGTVKIYDLSGREILSEKIVKKSEEETYNYDLSGNAAGAYAVEIRINNQKDNALIILK